MTKGVALKHFLLSLMYGMAIFIYLTFQGTYEKIAIVFMSVWTYVLIINPNKGNWHYYHRMIIGIFMGMFIAYFGFGSMPMENQMDEQLQGRRNNENIAVLLVFDGESATYDVALALHSHRKEITGIKEITIPLKLYQYKKSYEHLHISRYQEKATQIQEKLIELLAPHYDVYISYAEARPYYYEIMDQIILIESYDKVIVQPISIGESLEEIAAGNDKIMPFLIRSKSMVRHGNSLWDSEKIAKAVVKRVVGMEQETTMGDIGIILMAGGDVQGNQSQNWAKNMRKELLFMERVKTYFMQQGIESRKVITLDVVKGEKSLDEAVQQLRLYGVGKIYLTSIHDFLDKIENQSYIRKFIKKVEQQQGIDMKYIDGWGTEDLVIEELESRIRLLNVQE